MAKSDKSKSGVNSGKEESQTTPQTDEIIEAEVLEETPPPEDKTDDTAAADTGADDGETSASDDAQDKTEETDAGVPESAEGDDTLEAEAGGDATDTAEGDDALDPGPSDAEAQPFGEEPSQADDVSEAAEISDAAPEAVPAPVVQEKVIEKRGGFFPMLLGGVVAAGAGFLAAQYPDDWPFAAANGDTAVTEALAAIETQQGAIADLTSQVETLAGQTVPEVDLSPVTSAIGALGGRIDGVDEALAGLNATAEEFNTRLNVLERAPVEATVPPDAIQSYERELETLREAIAAQRAEIENIATRAVESEQNANAQAAVARARAAYAEVTAALENGQPFAASLATAAEGAGIDTPAALAAVADDGVATQRVLVEGFPSAARDALAAARATAATEGGFGNFLMDQLGARSVTPREGDSPDAILSRAEAAVRSGDLSGALAEMSALPEDVSAALGGWPVAAQARLDALEAADTLGQQLNDL